MTRVSITIWQKRDHHCRLYKAHGLKLDTDERIFHFASYALGLEYRTDETEGRTTLTWDGWSRHNHSDVGMMKHAHWFRVLVLLCQCLVCICSRLNMLAMRCFLRADASICKLPIGQKLFTPRWAPNHSLVSRRAMLAPSTREYLLTGLSHWLDALSGSRGSNSTRVQVWLLEVQQVYHLARWGRLFQCLLLVLVARIRRSNLIVHKASLHLVRGLLRLMAGESLMMTEVHIFVFSHSLAESTDGLSITSRGRLILHFLHFTDGSVSFRQTFLISCHFFTRSLDHAFFLWVRFSWVLWRGETHSVSLASSGSPGVGATRKHFELAVDKLCRTHLNWLLRL